jgi:hypothetical protein
MRKGVSKYATEADRKTARRQSHDRWAAKHPENLRKGTRRSMAKLEYGCPVELVGLWESNCLFGSCEICGRLPDSCRGGILQKDHSHLTAKPEPRGVLCPACNIALGKLQDSPSLLRKAADYLEDRDTRFNPDGIQAFATALAENLESTVKPAIVLPNDQTGSDAYQAG